jgi:RNA polymerase sigma-70 factor (ECF subfamily)
MKSVKTGSSFKEYTFVSTEKFSETSNSDIINRVLSGEIHLFEVIMRRYNQRLYRIQRSYISDEEALKDTLQQTYIKAFENLNSFRGESQFSTWITRIAINEALKYLNKKKRYSKLQLLHENNLKKEDSQNQPLSPEEAAIQNDYKQLLEEVIDTLPPKYRSVYIMREIEDMDTKETANCLNISESNVKVRLHRCKHLIQDALNLKLNETEIFDFMGKRCDMLVYRVIMQISQSIHKA